MHLTLVRYSYSPSETEGILSWKDSEQLATLEQPWVDSLNGTAYGAGAPYHSCIPEGRYQLIPFTRPNGHRTWALQNKRRGVYVYKGDRKHNWQRFLCILHRGNFVDDSAGCILPGEWRALLRNEDNHNMYERAVKDSASAMNHLRNELGELSAGHTLSIVQQRGALYAGD